MTRWGLFLGLAMPLLAHGQEHVLSWDDFSSTYFFDEAVAEDMRTRLEDLSQHPFNLNAASRADLLQLPFLSEAQADSILAYRDRRGGFLSLGELQLVSGLDYDVRSYLSLFTVVRQLAVSQAPRSKHDVETRLDLPLYRRQGERSGKYAGRGWYNNLRYRYALGQRVAAGLSLEKDAGEPFGAAGNHPYDFVSGFARLALGRVQLLAGDYRVAMGQGLLFGNGAFASKQMLLDAPRRVRSLLLPHTSMAEQDFFRGIGVTASLGGFGLSAFVSHVSQDARLEGDTVRTFLSTGYHRTAAELERRHAVGTTTAGGELSYGKQAWRVGAGGYVARYDHPVAPVLRSYNRYYLRGRQAAGLSLNYRYHARHITLTGEGAADGKFHLAVTNTLAFAPRNDLQLTLQHRSLSPRFVAPFADVLQESSRAANEHGLLLGVRYGGLRRWELRALADAYRFPRSTFQATGPSQGIEALVQGKYLLNKRVSLLLRYRTEAKQQDISGHRGVLEYKTTHRLRLQAACKLPRWEFHPQFDATLNSLQTGAAQRGWMGALRTVCRPTPRLRAAAFAAVFFTDSYASAVYAYEPALRHTMGSSAFYYHGLRLSTTAQWQCSAHLGVGLRYGLTHYFNRATIGSGDQLIAAPSKNDISLQLHWQP